MSAARGFSDGETFPLLEQDLSSEALICWVSLGPSHPALASLSVGRTTESKTWQQYKDECVPVDDYLPCGASLNDSITTTLLTLSWDASTFNNVPVAEKQGEPVDLYFEVFRSNGTGPRFLSGHLILTERVR